MLNPKSCEATSFTPCLGGDLWAPGPAATLLQPGQWVRAPCCKHEPLAHCLVWHKLASCRGGVMPSAQHRPRVQHRGGGTVPAQRGTQRRAEIVTVKPLLQKD